MEDDSALSVFLPRGIRRAPLFLLSFGIALLFLIPASASAKTWTVTTLQDSTGTTCGSTCSLRQAINAADNDTGDTIQFATGLTGTIELTSALPTITTGMAITGPGANLLTISGQGKYQIFDITAPYTATVNISGLTLADGNKFGGGAIYDPNSALNVDKCAFDGNSAGKSSGGAIASSMLTVTNSTFDSNHSGGNGGAIYAVFPTVTNSTFDDNSATGNGGAIYAGILTVANSTFDGNSAGGGGAIFAVVFEEAQKTVQNDIFADNNTGSTTSGAVVLGGTLVTEDHNLYYENYETGTTNESDAAGFTPDSTDKRNADPSLTALGYFGGPTETMMPEVGSKAICKGSDSDVSNLADGNDQRGFPIAPAVGACAKSTEVDIGAVQTNYVVVTSTSDTTGTCPGSSCTLPTAVADARTARYTDIGFDLSSSPATITLTRGMELNSGNTVIIGPPDAVTIDGNGAQILTVSGDSTFVSLYGLTLEDASSSSNGGAIENRGGDLAVGACTFHDDSAANGGAMASTGTLTVMGSTLYGNSATSSGGAIDSAGTLTVTGSTFHGDSAADAGGAINSDTSSTQGPAVADSTFYGNSATYGGAIDNETGTLTLTASTLRGNSAGSAGGGIDSEGGLTVVNSTLYGNSAANTGGAINGDTSSPQGLTVVDSTFIGNSAAGGSGAIDDSASSGPETVQNDIISGNIEGKGGFAVDFAGASPTEGYNLFYGNYIAGTAPPTESDTNLSSLAATDVTGNPDLTALGNFGGPTETMMPEVVSPAICAGLASDVPVGVDTDQRGFPIAPAAGACTNTRNVDIGSVQTNYVLVEKATGSGSCPGSSCSLPGAITTAEGQDYTDIGFSGFGTDPANPDTITLSNTLDLNEGNTVIVGPPDAVAIDGGGSPSGVQILSVSGSSTFVSLYGLTLEDGSANYVGGGAIENTNGATLAVANSTFTGNQAFGGGGAVYNVDGGTLTVTNSTFHDNKVLGDGGAIGNFAPALASGVSTLTVTNSTFDDNSAAGVIGSGVGRGGAIANVRPVPSECLDCSSASLTAVDNIFANNTAPAGIGGGIYNAGTIAIVDEEYNLFYNNTGGDADFALNGTDATGSDPELAPLDNYGGPTQTMLPLFGGAAICAGTPTLPSPLVLPTTDQRGLPRITTYASNGHPTACIDIGSVQSEADAQVVIDYIDNTLYAGGTLTGGQANSLVKELDKAYEMASEGKMGGAINNLNDFITEVEGLYSNDVLTLSEANTLITEAEQPFPLL